MAKVAIPTTNVPAGLRGDLHAAFVADAVRQGTPSDRGGASPRCSPNASPRNWKRSMRSRAAATSSRWRPTVPRRLR
jgi:hypothetical protein